MPCITPYSKAKSPEPRCSGCVRCASDWAVTGWSGWVVARCSTPPRRLPSRAGCRCASCPRWSPTMPPPAPCRCSTTRTVPSTMCCSTSAARTWWWWTPGSSPRRRCACWWLASAMLWRPTTRHAPACRATTTTSLAWPAVACNRARAAASRPSPRWPSPNCATRCCRPMRCKPCGPVRSSR
ncbi:hypothetical protein D3C75_936210 [compost metagenome]